MMQKSIRRLTSSQPPPPGPPLRILKVFGLTFKITWAEDRLKKRSYQVTVHNTYDWNHIHITAPKKLCGIYQTQMDWLRLLTLGSSEVASLKVTSISSRHMTVHKFWNYLKKYLASNDIKQEEGASLKTTSIPSMWHNNSLMFIV